MSSIAEALFLGYRYQRYLERENLKGLLRLTIQGRRAVGMAVSDEEPKYNKNSQDTSKWIDSLYGGDSSRERKAYRNRLAFAEDLDKLEANQQAAMESKVRTGFKKTLWFRLKWFFAGSTALLPSANTLLMLLGIAVGTVLMLTVLAVMAQAGILPGAWLLGSSLTSAALWLAAQLSITAGLGLPALIALAAFGGVIVMAFVVEWKSSGLFDKLFWGFDWNGDGNTPVHLTSLVAHEDHVEHVEHGVHPGRGQQFLNFLEKALGQATRLLFHPMKFDGPALILMLLLLLPVTLLVTLLYGLLLEGLNRLALYFSPPESRRAQPSHPFFAGLKWMLHIVFVLIFLPFFALAAILDTLYLAARLVYKDVTAKPAGIGSPIHEARRHRRRGLGSSNQLEIVASDAPSFGVPTNPTFLWTKTSTMVQNQGREESVEVYINVQKRESLSCKQIKESVSYTVQEHSVPGSEAGYLYITYTHEDGSLYYAASDGWKRSGEVEVSLSAAGAAGLNGAQAGASLSSSHLRRHETPALVSSMEFSESWETIECRGDWEKIMIEKSQKNPSDVGKIYYKNKSTGERRTDKPEDYDDLPLSYSNPGCIVQ